jgi:hypothetical protein
MKLAPSSYSCSWDHIPSDPHTSHSDSHHAQGLHPLSQQAEQLGAKIIKVRHGRQSNLKFRAEEYCCATTGAHLVAFGCDHLVVITAIKEAALSVPLERPPAEVWCVASSGVLTWAVSAGGLAARKALLRRRNRARTDTRTAGRGHGFQVCIRV